MQRRTHPNAIGCSWRSRQCDVCRRRLKFVQRFQYRSTFLRCVVIVECWLLTELTDSGVGFVASAFGLKWLIKTITNVTLFRRRYLFLHRFIDLNVSITKYEAIITEGWRLIINYDEQLICLTRSVVIVRLVIVVCCSTQRRVRSVDATFGVTVDANANSAFKFRRAMQFPGSGASVSFKFCAAKFGESVLKREFRWERERRW